MRTLLIGEELNEAGEFVAVTALTESEVLGRGRKAN
jgi:hypothetical protein